MTSNTYYMEQKNIHWSNIHTGEKLLAAATSASVWVLSFQT